MGAPPDPTSLWAGLFDLRENLLDGTLDDLRALAGLELANLGGAIVGRALYEELFTVADGQSALGD
jgi:hypothetical protein